MVVPPVYEPIRRALPIDQWPPEDRNAWENAHRDTGPFDNPGNAVHWRPDTRRSYRFAYGRWLSFLQYTGRLDVDTGPKYRVTADNISAYVAMLQTQVKPVTVWGYLNELHNVLYAIAQDGDWGWLHGIVNRLHLSISPRTDLPAKLRPIDEIYRLGLVLMQRAETEVPMRPLDDSVHHRDGLMIALLASAPVRLKNFAMLQIGTDLLSTSDGYLIVIPKEEVKNKQPIEFDVMESLVPHIDRYLDHHRPRLLKDTASNRLWVSKAGRPIKPHHVSARITKVTKRELDVAISPHVFRHCAATSIADTTSELARMIRPLLSHTTNATSERYYNKGSILRASQQQAMVIDRLRERQEQTGMEEGP